MSNILYIIRGLPGSGKSTLGTALTNGSGHVYSADDYFMDFDGNYNFDPSKLSAAHEGCKDGVRNALEKGYSPVAVANTFSQKWEADPYFVMAGENKYTVVVIECQSEFGSEHGVPAATVAAMAARWETILPSVADLLYTVQESQINTLRAAYAMNDVSRNLVLRSLLVAAHAALGLRAVNDAVNAEFMEKIALRFE
jgi:hypothetical protein